MASQLFSVIRIAIPVSCVLCFILGTSALAEVAKLAVLGDSISTGAHAEPRDINGYPARLSYLFANEFEVRAFARSSLCVLRKADLPLANTSEFQAALSWAPDVATIMLGTNDTVDTHRTNWQHQADLAADTLYLINALREKNANVVVHLLGPPPMFTTQGKDASRIEQLQARAPRLQVIAEVYRQIAASEPNVFYHDLTRSFDTTSDGVHPDNFGHEALGHELFERLSIDYNEAFDIGVNLQTANIEFQQDRWHGYRRYTFKLDGADCHLVAPHQVANTHPWIWRARFFGHEPALDLSLLDRGFHLAYCDVSNLYGSPPALARWDKFYALATEQLHLAAKPVLEGMSRGGLPIFYWSSRHPDRVAAIYGDNPVCNSHSWPGGTNGKRSDEDWNRLLSAYKLTSDQADHLPQPYQRDVLRPIAENNIPVALVVGMADEVVPPNENSLTLEKAYQSLGGQVKMWRKPGAGHHPHGLHPPDALRRYLCRACGIMENPATQAEPSAEFRAGAGWGSDWHTAFAHLKQSVAEHPQSSLVFLGDSITQGLTGHNDRAARTEGQRAIDRYFGNRQALSLGLSGDRTEHVLWRLQNGQLEDLTPKEVVLMIGVNNINSGGHTGEETAEGTAAIVSWLREHRPTARILLLGCFPAGHQPDDPRRDEIDALHQAIQPLADGEQVIYKDLRPLFLNDDGTLNENMRSDAIHISPQGQEVWMRAVSEVLPSDN